MELGDRHGAARTYHQLGGAAQEQRRFVEAEAAYRQALDIYLESDGRAASSTAAQLGVVLAELGRHSAAAAMLLRAAVSWRQEAGQWSSLGLHLLRQERGKLRDAEFTMLVRTSS